MTRIAHVDMVVADVERALEFYVGALDCKVLDDAVIRFPSLAALSGAPRDLVRVILLQLPGPGMGKSTIELMAFEGGTGAPVTFGSSTSFVPSMWSFSLVVDELEPYIEKLSSKGVTTVTPIETVRMPRAGVCRVTFIRDPDGNLIELMDVPRRAPVDAGSSTPTK